MPTFLASPVFWSFFVLLVVQLLATGRAARTFRRVEQLEERIATIEGFGDELVARLEKEQLAPVAGDATAADPTIVLPEVERRTEATRRIVQDLTTSRRELDAAWKLLLHIGDADPSDTVAKCQAIEQTTGAVIFGVLALHHVTEHFLREFQGVRDFGNAGYLRFPGLFDYFREIDRTNDKLPEVHS